HFWLIQLKSSKYDYLFNSLNLNVNCDLKVAYLNLVTAIKSFKYTIHDVYNPAFERGGKLRTTEVGFYNDEKKFLWIDPRNSYSDRNNLTGIEFKTVIVLPEAFDGTLGSYLKYDREVQINTFNRFHSRLMHYCKDYYNFRLSVKFRGYELTKKYHTLME
ncbi:hypothetical protein D910_01941, partial [Dendroctonus ponderosae]